MIKARGFFSIGLLLAILFVILSFTALGYQMHAKLGLLLGQDDSTKTDPDASKLLHALVYEIDAGVVYYRRPHDPETARQPLSGADAATFSVLKTPDGSPTSFAKDARQIYFPATYFFQNAVSVVRFTAADPATFSIIGVPDTQGPNAVVFLKDKDKVFYAHRDNKTGSVVIDPIQDADPASFALLPNATDSGRGYTFARDKNHVFFISQTGTASIVPNADAATFALLPSVKATNTLFWKDRTAVYYLQGDVGGVPQFKSLSADPSTLVSVYDSRGEETNYLKDSQRVYYKNYERVHGQANTKLTISLVTGADPATFRVDASLDQTGTLGMDKAHVYDATTTVQYADPASFAYAFSSYYKDRQHVYYAADNATIRIIPGADPATFALMPQLNGNINTRQKTEFTRDVAHVYKNGQLIAGAKPDSFAILPSESGQPSGYYRDATRVFYTSSSGTITLIPGSDAATFVILDTYADLAKDRYAVYQGDRILPIDAHSFVPVTDARGNVTGYWKDATQVYYISYDDYDEPTLKLTPLSGADPVTFVATEACDAYAYSDCITDAKDKNHSYLYGEVVQP